MLEAIKHKSGEVRKNRALRKRFKELKLNVEEVWFPCPGNVELENRRLGNLLDWVLAYRANPNRQTLEARGYMHPPVEPDFDPDNDWLIFESWVQGRPVAWQFEQVFGPVAPADGLTDEEIVARLIRISEQLMSRGVCIDYQDEVPMRLAYTELRKNLQASKFEILASGVTCHVTGCAGYCPDCFQRPWCEMGGDLSWPEDEALGHMAIPAVCLPFVDDKKRARSGAGPTWSGRFG